MLIFSDSENGCTQGSFWALMRATRKAILMDARNDFWATDAHKVWGKSWMRTTYIPDARNSSNRQTFEGRGARAIFLSIGFMRF